MDLRIMFSHNHITRPSYMVHPNRHKITKVTHTKVITTKATASTGNTLTPNIIIMAVIEAKTEAEAEVVDPPPLTAPIFNMTEVAKRSVFLTVMFNFTIVKTVVITLFTLVTRTAQENDL